MEQLANICVHTAMSSQKITYPWWYGGAGGIFATVCTHPLDLAKVRLQAAPYPKPTIPGMISQIIRNDSFLGLYAGLSASILRQCTYTTARLGLYNFIKENVLPNDSMNYLLLASIVSGAVGGLFGNFADVVNIRMQNDSALPSNLRRNYKNVFDGIYKIVKYENGLKACFIGWKPNVLRGILMTSSQAVTYDSTKLKLVNSFHFSDNSHWTHFLSSLFAGLVATTVSSPVDVIKTKIMNALEDSHGKNTFKILSQAIRQEGPSFLFRGWLPSFTRLGPHTMLIFLTMEQLKKHKIGMS
ncbi:hypothetical protein KAFR_0A06340 [Kazachstania africana CBS 2517]|uniref:Mitochondrial dicarboxylate transporter n=1 Tax=Kazachstania africana (strain ATCC 22294 / BCRC 22015 / CBS 2517 / CECT 1963 / NBRC 1671 / NRRL Y-8276) TaxID=1071382 RepID=H2ANW9_KAZAF|nr:hypothetical protein KAFR_0A06340 [Kazachstania africana CBS 2517]CCF56069.1 hypothetical protein KAFR_0A06340 [Kazachstania africana CBS 2517]